MVDKVGQKSILQEEMEGMKLGMRLEVHLTSGAAVIGKLADTHEASVSFVLDRGKKGLYEVAYSDVEKIRTKSIVMTQIGFVLGLALDILFVRDFSWPGPSGG